jgi:hypothetical protein
MIIVNTYPKIRTSADMLPLTEWLKQNASSNWSWRVSNEWYQGWGHPMLIDFDSERDAVHFILRWS